MSHRTWAIPLVLYSLLLSACGGKSDGFSAYDGLKLTRDRTKLVRDETQTLDVLVQLARGERTGTTVNFSASGLPDGVTAAFSPPSMTLNDTNIHTVRMTLVAERDVPVGKSQVIVHRNGGAENQSQRMELQMVDFAVGIEVDDTDVTLDPGETQDIDVVLTRRGNSNGTVEMTLGGDVPDGVSWSLSPARVLIDPSNTRVHVRLRLEADNDLGNDDEETCRVRALKGVNTDQSDGIKVRAEAPEIEE